GGEEDVEERRHVGLRPCLRTLGRRVRRELLGELARRTTLPRGGAQSGVRREVSVRRIACALELKILSGDGAQLLGQPVDCVSGQLPPAERTSPRAAPAPTTFPRRSRRRRPR